MRLMTGRAGDPPDGTPGLRRLLARLALTVFILAALAAAVTHSLAVLFPGFGRWDPATARVPAGVVFEYGETRVELGGLSRFEAHGALEEVAGAFSVLPRNAYFDRVSRGVVPGLEGRRLDIAATVARAVEAAPGQVVGPVFYAVPPAVTLADFPDAPVYQGNPLKSAVAVVLNVAWGDEYLDPILELVGASGGRLTVCPVGEWLEGRPDRAAWLRSAAERGHEIGNHGYYNRPMTYPDQSQIAEEIEATSDLIEDACGRRPTFFAPPMGAISEAMLAVASRAGYRTVLWSLDTIDWRLEGVEVIVQRVVTRVKAGDIILCHPTVQTGPAFERILPVLAEKGLRVVTLSDLLSPALEPGAGEND